MKSLKHHLESFHSGNLDNFCPEWRKSPRFDTISEHNNFLRFEIRDFFKSFLCLQYTDYYAQCGLLLAACSGLCSLISYIHNLQL